MLCSVFALINCPLILIIPSAKIAQSVKHWIGNKGLTYSQLQVQGSNRAGSCFVTRHIILNYCTAVQLTVSSWLIIMDIQHWFLCYIMVNLCLLFPYPVFLCNMYSYCSWLTVVLDSGQLMPFWCVWSTELNVDSGLLQMKWRPWIECW